MGEERGTERGGATTSATVQDQKRALDKKQHGCKTALAQEKAEETMDILMNWQKRGADWKLLSRGSTEL